MAEKTGDAQEDTEAEQFTVSEVTDVTTSHYVCKDSRDRCQNESCGQTFNQPYNIRRPHHCRRCGEIFCRPCLQYKRRLDAMAQPSPDGVLCKVCLKCFEDRVVYLSGTRRSQTELFCLLRRQYKAEMSDIVYEYAIVTRGVSEHPAFWKEQFKVDILKECLRLLKGFQSSTGKSETLKAVHGIKDYMNVPPWQKSSFWSLESHTSKCRQCGGKLGHRKKIRNCRVCGLTMCKYCSQKDLLLYFPDDKDSTDDKSAQLAIIRYLGCPATEPRNCMLLYCCNDCKAEIVQRQLEDDRWYLQKPKPADIESEIVLLDEQFSLLEHQIRNDIEQLTLLPTATEDTVESSDDLSDVDSTDGLLEPQTQTSSTVTSLQRTETLIACIHKKLRTYWDMYSRLKSVLKNNPSKPTRRHLDFVMNYFTAKKDFYIQTKAELSGVSGMVETSTSGRPQTNVFDTIEQDILESEEPNLQSFLS